MESYSCQDLTQSIEAFRNKRVWDKGKVVMLSDVDHTSTRPTERAIKHPVHVVCTWGTGKRSRQRDMGSNVAAPHVDPALLTALLVVVS